MRALLVGSSGYIGSFLKGSLRQQEGIELTCVDLRPDPVGGATDYLGSYTDLPASRIQEHDVVLFFAGCSSVADAVRDSRLALDKNVLEPIRMAEKLAPQQRLIYASSASVYSQSAGRSSTIESLPSSEKDPIGPPSNAYDATKAAFDMLIPLTAAHAVGLRLGTVSGFSPGFRSELVFNAMVGRACRQEPIRLSNADSWRSILFLEDLTSLILVLMKLQEFPAPVINVGSLNIRMGDLASRIAQHFGTAVRHSPDSTTYSFTLNTSLARGICDVTCKSLEQRATQLAGHILKERA